MENDYNSKIFTFVYIDSDRQDFVRIIKKAAKDNLLTGGFIISDPDIEFGNFSLDELIEIVLITAKENKIQIDEKISLRKSID